MNADDMLKELGYEKTIDSDEKFMTYYRIGKCGLVEHRYDLSFWVENEVMFRAEETDIGWAEQRWGMTIDRKLHKAINKKIEELEEKK